MTQLVLKYPSEDGDRPMKAMNLLSSSSLDVYTF